MTYPLTARWNYPTTIHVGAGLIKDLPQHAKDLGFARPLLVTDKNLAHLPMIQSALKSLEQAGLGAKCFAEVQGNPTDSNLAACIEAFRSGRHDGIIAIGGGSAMDVGKLCALMEGQSIPVWDLEDIGDWWRRANADVIHKVIAVPTTAGTGSEVGRAAVVTNTQDHSKKIIFHPKMQPALVLGDPELASGLPPHLTAAVGMDAFTHCFETYCVASFHPLSDGIALQGMRLIKDFLPRAVENGGDIEARTWMFAAALMGGTAFQKGLGAVHSLAHALGALHDIHHGLANAVILPYVAVFNRVAIEDKVITLNKLLDIDGGFDGFLRWLLQFRKQLGIPHSLAELNLSAESADEIAAKALPDPSTACNPRSMLLGDFKRLYLAALEGNLSSG